MAQASSAAGSRFPFASSPTRPKGSLDDAAPFELVDYLQLASVAGRSGVLTVDARGLGLGRIEVVDGEVWNASVGPLTGAKALSFLVFEQDPIVSIEPLTEKPTHREITTPLSGLLLDLAKERDELKKSETASTPTASTDRFQALCSASLEKLPAGSGLIVMEADPARVLAHACPKGASWVEFAPLASATAAGLIREASQRRLSFLPPESSQEGEVDRAGEIYLASSGCRYFIASPSTQPHLAVVLVTSLHCTQAEGWFALRRLLPQVEESAEEPRTGTDFATQRCRPYRI